jgi:quercetin dioxygenase-like cupin family protein
MFTKHNRDGYREALPGIRIKTLCYGDRTLMTEFQMDAGSALPMHGHAHEQTGYLVRGHVVLTIGAVSHDVGPGDSWCIGADVEHGAQILEDSVAVEVFSPVREDYLPPGVR